MLEVLNKTDLSDGERSFVNLHESIVRQAQFTGLSLYEFCKLLKEMRDSKKYVYAGLKNFEDYAINVLGLKKSQAYNFCQIADNVSPDIFQSIGKVGSTKLLLISKLIPELQEKVIEENNIEKITVNDLKEEIEKLNKELKETKENNTNLENENKTLNSDIFIKDEEIEELRDKINYLEENPKIIEKEDLESKAKIKELETKIKNQEINNNDSISKFKVIFEIIKKDILMAKEMISFFSDEDKDKCNKVLRKLIELI